MFLKFSIIFWIFIFTFSLVNSQTPYNLKQPTNTNYQGKCSRCVNVLGSMPKEVQFTVISDENYNIYLAVTDKQWFDKLFRGGGDGIAVDIISKDQYVCGKETDYSDFWPNKGTLLPPVYLKDLKKNALPSQYGEIITPLGMVPEELRDKEIEYNFLVIQKKHVCYYHMSYGLQRYKWDLLDMGLYMDTLTYMSRFDTTGNKKEIFMLHNKRFKFVIPFEKDKAEYSPEDVKPVYDSLNLTDFNIKKIIIRAYSSVEGPEERNIELQEKRAQSIVDALQSYQSPAITTQIHASENWLEFYKDIEGSSYSDLAKLSKQEIKERLNNKELSEKLEQYLKNHRKAVLILELEKKSSVVDYEPEKLIQAFNKAVEDKDIQKAMEIQRTVFNKIAGNQLPSNFIDKLETPEQKDYIPLMKHKAAFSYFFDISDVVSALRDFTEMLQIAPDDGQLKYNICALKFHKWIYTGEFVDPVGFKKEIEQLGRSGIQRSLVKRMLINYNIIMCEYYMYIKDYANKDKALRYIKTNYKYVPTSDHDLLSLAQYFAAYAKYDWAEKLLLPYVTKVDIEEDLLFYYLNLTIVDEGKTRQSTYRKVMLNAISINKERFCRLFDPYSAGGVTFQLLENKYLKETYCENCD